MENLLFSLNVTIPIFLVMVIGYGLRFTSIVTEDFVNRLNKLNYNITLPVLLFTDLSVVNFQEVWDTTYVLYCFGVTLFCILIIWGIAALTLRFSPLSGEFVQASYRGSAAVLGIAFIQNIYGSSVMGPLMILGTVPLYNIMAVIILSVTDPTGQGLGQNALKASFKGILTNPILIAILLGLLFSLLPFELPAFCSKTLDNIARLATPLALLALGAGFEGRKALTMIKPTLFAVFIKLLLLPAVFLPLAIHLGFRGESLVAVLVMLGAPTTVSAYIMSKNTHHDGTLTASCVVASTFLSSVTLTFWLFLLKQQGLLS